jgi:ABC-type Fe3+ transport system permease subunit
MAFGFVAMSLRWPFADGDPLEGWSMSSALSQSNSALIIAYAIRRLPYVVRSTCRGTAADIR